MTATLRIVATVASRIINLEKEVRFREFIFFAMCKDRFKKRACVGGGKCK